MRRSVDDMRDRGDHQLRCARDTWYMLVMSLGTHVHGGCLQSIEVREALFLPCIIGRGAISTGNRTQTSWPSRDLGRHDCDSRISECSDDRVQEPRVNEDPSQPTSPQLAHLPTVAAASGWWSSPTVVPQSKYRPEARS
jgi:hypothetical protein